MQEIPLPADEPIQQSTFPRLRLWKEMAILAQMVMELAWIVPWYRSLTGGTNQAGTWRVFTIFLVIMLVFHWAARLMNFLNIRLVLRRTVLIGLLLVAIFGGLRYLLYYAVPVSLLDTFIKPVAAFADILVLIPDEFVIILAILFVAFRGISIASQRTSASDMLVRFQFGMVMIVLYIMLNTLVTNEAPGNIVFVFLFSGLIAIGTARMTVLEGLRGGREVPFDRRWFLGLVLSALLVILAAYAAAQFTNYPLFRFLIQVITALFSFIIGVLLILLMPLFLLIISGLLWLVENIRLTDLLPNLMEGLDTALNNLANLTNQLMAFAQNLLPDLSFARPYILLGGIILVIVFGLIFIGLNWLLKNYRNLEIEDLESLLESGDWLRLLRRLVQNNLKKLGRSLEGSLLFFNRDRRRAAKRIRQIYQEMVELGSELGAARQEAETPNEYLLRLVGLFPDEEGQVSRITSAYVKIRYGEYPESLAEVAAIEQDWDIVRKAAKTRLAEKQEDPADPAVN